MLLLLCTQFGILNPQISKLLFALSQFLIICDCSYLYIISIFLLNKTMGYLLRGCRWYRLVFKHHLAIGATDLWIRVCTNTQTVNVNLPALLTNLVKVFELKIFKFIYLSLYLFSFRLTGILFYEQGTVELWKTIL